MIELNTEWKSVDTTGEPCSACKEPIYGNQYQLFLMGKPTETILCQSCFDAVEKD